MLSTNHICSSNINIDISPSKVSLVQSRYSLHIGHINARSISRHIDELRVLYIFGVSEIWLNKSKPLSSYKIPEFKIFLNDRYRLGGGVALYVNQSLKAKTIANSTQGINFEYILVEITVNFYLFLVGVFYLPPSANIQPFEALLPEKLLKYKHLLSD